MSEFAPAFAYLLPHEGGFVDDAADPGGATNYGISLYWLKSIGELDLADVNHDGRVDINDIRALTPSGAAHLYQQFWWDHYDLGRVAAQPVASKLFDHAVNMGGIPAIRHLQAAANACGARVGCDGQLGPISLAAINQFAPAPLLTAYCAELMKFYRTLVVQKPQFEKFQNGWLRRAQELPSP